jgi:membrane protease YdiL (CAAX protease family)
VDDSSLSFWQNSAISYLMDTLMKFSLTNIPPINITPMKVKSIFFRSNTGKIAALSEITGVFFVGSLLSSLLFQWADIRGNPLAALLEVNPDMFAISWQLAKVLFLQYAGWLTLALVLNFAYRHSGRKDIGITLNGQRFIMLSLMAIVAWAVADFAFKIIWILDAEFDIGTSVPWREALINGEKSAGWWALMAVGSFGLVPVLEELFWRGYVQARLHHSFSPSIAIVASAAMFTFSHSQYHHFDGYHIATIGALFFNALVLGWLFHTTRSLWPVIFMHALVNTPTDGISMYLAIAIMSVIISLNWQLILRAYKEFKTLFITDRYQIVDIVAIIVVSAMMFALSQAPQWVMYFGYIGLPLAAIWAVSYRVVARNAVKSLVQY